MNDEHPARIRARELAEWFVFGDPKPTLDTITVAIYLTAGDWDLPPRTVLGWYQMFFTEAATRRRHE